jgi:hypothetical protein
LFTLQLFTEILVVGALLLLGAMPLLLLLDRQSLLKGRLLPFIDHFDSNLPITFVLLVMAYAVGAAGNRLVDSLWDGANELVDAVVHSGQACANNEDYYNHKLVAYLAAARPAPQPPAAQPDPKPTAPGRIDCPPALAGKVNCIKVAEFALRERGSATREWLDNRRTYIRIMRSASFAALLFLVSIFVYNRLARRLRRKERARVLERQKGAAETRYDPSFLLLGAPADITIQAPPRRDYHHYRPAHYATAAFLLVVFSCANYIADEKYWQRVYELYVTLPPVSQEKRAGGD